MDRLHTCYAPVRRSPPMYCYTALPLDLHVLGLSLAFILSQDQTLRCCYLFLVFFLSIIRPRKSSPPKLRYLPRLSDAQIYRFYTCAKNHCDVDSVTFSCVTAAPVRTPHLPCLSLFLVYRNHFNELIFMQTRQPSATRKPRLSPAPFHRG